MTGWEGPERMYIYGSDFFACIRADLPSDEAHHLLYLHFLNFRRSDVFRILQDPGWRTTILRNRTKSPSPLVQRTLQEHSS